MQGLLLIAHGSRRDESNTEFIDLVDAIKPALADDFQSIQAAFLELCEPQIGQAIDQMIKEGMMTITVLPYFLNQGRHVTEDVPGEIERKRIQYPDVGMNILPYFGQAGQIGSLIINLVKSNYTHKQPASDKGS